VWVHRRFCTFPLQDESQRSLLANLHICIDDIVSNWAIGYTVSDDVTLYYQCVDGMGFGTSEVICDGRGWSFSLSFAIQDLGY